MTEEETFLDDPSRVMWSEWMEMAVLAA